MQIDYTGFDRPHLIASTTRMAAAEFSGTLTFTSSPAGTVLRWSWQVRPRGVMWLVAPIFGPIGARRERRTWDGLRDHLEAAGNAPSVLDRYLPDFDVRERHTRLLCRSRRGPKRPSPHTDLPAPRSSGRCSSCAPSPAGSGSDWAGAPHRFHRRSPWPTCRGQGGFCSPRAGRRSRLGRSPAPWRIGDEAPLRVDRESFAGFSTPGYAKIVFSIRADP